MLIVVWTGRTCDVGVIRVTSRIQELLTEFLPLRNTEYRRVFCGISFIGGGLRFLRASSLYDAFQIILVSQTRLSDDGLHILDDFTRESETKVIPHFSLRGQRSTS